MTFFKRLRSWARRLKREVTALWLAARDPRTPPAAKIVAALVAAYALSPIDLIPDFVPVLGMVDDLLLVPAGVWLALRLVPPPLMAELRARAAAESQRPTSRSAAAAIIAVWVLAGAASALWLWRVVSA